MTHLTREAQRGRTARRAEIRDNLVNGLFTPYTFLCVVLLLGGVALTGFDAKGLPLLVIAAVLVAFIRLLYTIRAELPPDVVRNVMAQQYFEGEGSEQDIVDWAHGHMAAYKSPRIVEFVESLPMTSTGKILKRELS